MKILIIFAFLLLSTLAHCSYSFTSPQNSEISKDFVHTIMFAGGLCMIVLFWLSLGRFLGRKYYTTRNRGEQESFEQVI
jgi:hypothetical protein